MIIRCNHNKSKQVIDGVFLPSYQFQTLATQTLVSEYWSKENGIRRNGRQRVKRWHRSKNTRGSLCIYSQKSINEHSYIHIDKDLATTGWLSKYMHLPLAAATEPGAGKGVTWKKRNKELHHVRIKNFTRNSSSSNIVVKTEKKLYEPLTVTDCSIAMLTHTIPQAAP